MMVNGEMHQSLSHRSSGSTEERSYEIEIEPRSWWNSENAGSPRNRSTTNCVEIALKQTHPMFIYEINILTSLVTKSAGLTVV